MIFDAEDLTKVLKPLLLESTRQGHFEAEMMARQMNVRYIGPGEDVVALFQEGKLNKQEVEFYHGRVKWELERRAEAEAAAAHERNFHRVDPEEVKRLYGTDGMAGQVAAAVAGVTKPSA